MEVLKWTMQTPTVPGWYWMRSLDWNGIRVREVRYYEGRLAVDPTTSLPKPLSWYEGWEWAGPIPEPVEG